MTGVHLAEAFATADVHISSLLAVFLTPELNPVWNERLVEQRLFMLDGKRVAFQVYDLPWPIANREFLIYCHDTASASDYVYGSSCRSVVSDELPVGEGRVRAHIQEAHWRFEAQPDGQTAIRFKGSVDPMGPLPKWLISAAQKVISKSTIQGLLGAQKMLGVPPLERFQHWGGAGLAAANTCGARDGKENPVSSWCRRTHWCPFARPCAPPPQPIAVAAPAPPEPILLQAILLCVGVALTAWVARRLNWQGLVRLFVRARQQQQLRTVKSAVAMPEATAPLRKVRSDIMMQRHHLRLGAQHGQQGEVEAALPGDLTLVLGGADVAQQMRRCASHSGHVQRRKPSMVQEIA